MKPQRDCDYIIGIDEAGRAPLAGPVAVGLVAVPADFDFEIFKEAQDSKVLTPAGRDTWYARMEAAQDEGFICTVTHVRHHVIDREGLTTACAIAVRRLLKNFNEERSTVYLDGLLQAPQRFQRQVTVVGGDTKIPLISCASIAAKVERDRKMIRYSRRFPEYGFEKHKGYGTREHRKNIKKHGLCPIHRRRFCAGLTKQ